MSDIVERLQSWADKKVGDPLPNYWGAELISVLVDAIDEIKRLRSVAGTVSDGPSLADIKTTQHSHG